MKRRHFIVGGIGAALGLAYWRYWPEDGLWNPCDNSRMPDSLLQHEIIQTAFNGLKASQVWDVHVHLVGVGDSSIVNQNRVWVNPKMQSWMSPLLKTQYKFYLNAACVENSVVDRSYVSRLYAIAQAFPPGYKFMLLAFDYRYDKSGKRNLEQSPMYTANEYTYRVVQRYPDRFEWICSIHPYRPDAVEQLERAIQNGARAVKWLPAAMGINVASKRCDAFYQTLVKHNIPLLTHAGHEQAVQNNESKNFGNPLLLRYPLEKGVRVIVAHCASLGEYVDIDRLGSKKRVDSFKLFARLMEESSYQNNLYADVSAMFQFNRVGEALKSVLTKSDWHARLLNGSDYPLPGILPLISLRQLHNLGFINKNEVEILLKIRRYNPLLFDFVLKRITRYKRHKFSNDVFHTRRIFLDSKSQPMR